ncbi:Hvo_1808 family surface protein [Haloarcula marina]|uniref:Hvo_1808 family surface protein n=1 Tax=Haloarcula marina TaxID=2961574 RepID=UPI0020B824D8|nr:Hvo_1808 family surface protein [Halomicroarcula marina]
MRRQFAALCCAVVLLVLLAGCQGFGVGSDGDGTATASPTPEADYVFTLDGEGSDDTAAPTATPPADGARPDPENDTIGWENGYWHDETLSVTTDDGLNESERAAVVARSMARVEFVRQLEFERSVPVDTVSRAAYRANNTYETGETLRRFDNAKFEALFLVGEDRDSVATQQGTLGSSVLGYYSSRRDAIVLVTDSETPTIDEATLGHELVHALQDQHFGFDGSARTRDAVQGRNGLVEGDAAATEDRYVARCGEQWDCLSGGAGGGGGGGDRHFGISFLVYFPYSDGPGLVENLHDRGGWARVNEAYDETPEGAREVMRPEDYPAWEPRNVTLSDRSTDEWERVRPSTDRDRPDYAVVGPSAIAASMAYTLADGYNESAVVSRRAVFNYAASGGLDSTDPYNYALPATTEWEGGRMYAYTRANATNTTETAYVWRTVWSDEAAAATFATTWEAVIAHWGGTETADGNWVIESESPFADAVAVRVDGNTVTVVNAPTEADLHEVHDA